MANQSLREAVARTAAARTPFEITKDMDKLARKLLGLNNELKRVARRHKAQSLAAQTQKMSAAINEVIKISQEAGHGEHGSLM